MRTALAELEGLKAELEKARHEAEQQKAASAKAEKAQADEKVAREKDQARFMEVEETRKGVFEAHDKLQAEEEHAKEEIKMLHIAHSKQRSTRIFQSVANTVQHFGQLEGHEEEKAFWRQFWTLHRHNC